MNLMTVLVVMEVFMLGFLVDISINLRRLNENVRKLNK